jgi:hypothetical protein
MVWSALFTIGQYLYGHTGLAIGLGAIAVLSAAALARVARALWPSDTDAEAAATQDVSA